MRIREAIRALRKRGYSKRRIARELGVHRKTVDNYLRGGEEPAHAPEGSKCTIPTTGPPASAKAPEPPVPPENRRASQAKCTIPTTGPGRLSHCEAYREIIREKLDQGLHAMRIWQDLAEEHGFPHAYESVKRFVRKLKAQNPKRIWRMEVLPGQEAQLDYATLWVRIGGKRRKIHVLRVVLSHSRKGYTEAMARQDTESFIRAIENAFRHFGGVPGLLVLDNLKAGVLKPCIYEPELNPKFESFCRHYATTPMPTRPRTPQHKGKVESDVSYVKNNALKARRFDSLAALNAHLRHWEKHVADLRIHGTTRKQVGACFAESEKPALRPLPDGLFPSFEEAPRKIQRDAYLSFKRAFYEVPPEYIGREVWVRSDGRIVRILNAKRQQIAVHPKLEAGKFSKSLGVSGVPGSIEESLGYWVRRAAKDIGAQTGRWAAQLAARRKAAALRLLTALCNRLLPRHGARALEAACARASELDQYSYAELKTLLENPQPAQQTFGFLEENEIIRDMKAYSGFASFTGPGAPENQNHPARRTPSRPPAPKTQNQSQTQTSKPK